VVREEFGGWRAAILFGDNAAGRVMEQQFTFPLTQAWRSMNGGIPIRLMTANVSAALKLESECEVHVVVRERPRDVRRADATVFQAENEGTRGTPFRVR
jgi:hypothetical protein